MNDLQPIEIIPAETTKSKRDFEVWMQSKQNKYNAATYNLAKNNCNNFAAGAIAFLANGARIPKHILGLPMRIALAPRAAMLMPLVEGITKAMKSGGQLDPSIVARIPRGETIVPMINALLRSLSAQVRGDTTNDNSQSCCCFLTFSPATRTHMHTHTHARRPAERC
jgi:hypothetical protein